MARHNRKKTQRRVMPERDGPTKEQALKHTYEPVLAEKGTKGERNKVQTVRCVDSDTLDRLWTRSEISKRQHDAGLMYQEDCDKAGRNPNITSSLVFIDHGRGGEVSDITRIDAQRRLIAARAALIKSHVIAIDAAIWERLPCVDVGKKLGYTGRGGASAVGKSTVKDALESLANHYRL